MDASFAAGAVDVTNEAINFVQQECLIPSPVPGSDASLAMW